MQMEVNLHSAGSIKVFPTIEINHKEHIPQRLELRPRQDSLGRNALNSEPRSGSPLNLERRHTSLWGTVCFNLLIYIFKRGRLMDECKVAILTLKHLLHKSFKQGN